MSNYPPPPPYGGAVFPHGQIPFPPPSNGFPTNYQNQPQAQYLHHQQPHQNLQNTYQNGLANGHMPQYPASSPFGPAPFQHLAPPPPHQPPPNPYSYPQFVANNIAQQYAHSQGHTPLPSPFYPPGAMASPITPYPNTQHSFGLPSPGGNATRGTNAVEGALGHAGLDGTDEAIRRALATIGTNRADLPVPSLPTANNAAADQAVKKTHQTAGKPMPKTKAPKPHPIPLKPIKDTQSSSYLQSQPSTLPGLLSVSKETKVQTQHRTDADSSATGSGKSLESWQEKRDQAKKAVTEMLRGGITFDQISQEGVEMQLLYDLFPELAVNTASTGSAKLPPRTSPKITSVRQSETSLESGEVSEENDQAERPTTAESTQKPAARPITPVKSSPQNIAHSQISRKDSTAKPAEERNNYIARLLAAKQSISKEPEKANEMALDGSSSSKTAPSATSAAANSLLQDGGKIDKPTIIASPKRPETKDPVQTELVRKRLEALKAASRPVPIKTSSTQVEKATTSSTKDASTSLPAPAHPTSQQKSKLFGTHGHNVAPKAASQDAFISSSSSFYAHDDAQVFAGLPGLSPVLVKENPPFGQHQPPPSPPTDDRGQEEGLDSDVARFLDSYADSSNSLGTPSADVNVNGSSRKRAMAIDFIDSESPPPAKRRAGSDEHIELVIDVSDDEEGEIKDSGPSPKTTFSRLSTQSSTTSPHVRPSQLKTASEIFNGPQSLPTIQTPRKLTDLEAEMKIMRQKIAERQRHKRALKTQEVSESAEATTGGTNSGIASPAAAVDNSVQVLEDVQLNATQQQQRALAVSRSMLQEKLEAERRTHALITAHAENEKRQAAGATTESEKTLRLDRKAVLEAAIPKLDASINGTIQRLETIRKQQDEIQEDLHKGQRERQALIDELNTLLAPSSSKDVVQDSQSPVIKRAQSPETQLKPSSAPLRGRNAVEGDSVAPNLTSALESPSQAPVSVPSHAESNDNLLEDAMDISGPSDAEAQQSSSDHSEAGSLFDTNAREAEATELELDPALADARATPRDETQFEPQEPYEPSMDEMFSDDDNGEDVESGPVATSQEVFPVSRSSHSGSSQFDEAEFYEPMESEVQETINMGPAMSADATSEEANVYYPTPSAVESTNEIRASGSVAVQSDQASFDEADAEVDTYEPILSKAEDADLQAAIGTMVQQEPSDESMVASPAANQGKVSQVGESGHVSPASVNRASEEGEISDEEMSSSDGYEPPEPVEDSDQHLDVPPVTISQNGPRASASADGESVTQDRPVGEDSGALIENTSTQSARQFQPYESPLKRFASYRFHPQYVAKISGGYKSLTFSHNIRTHVPLCRWETAGGVCNDPTCELQHFRDLSVTGNSLLQQLISYTEGKSREEAERYRSGLRALLADMRDRNPQSEQHTAEAIVAYRTRFLDDPSRVVSFAETA